MDCRGTQFTHLVLSQLLDAVREPTTSLPHLGRTSFAQAAFAEDADFEHVTFSDSVKFDEATFSCDALFRHAKFLGSAHFNHVTFSGDARFREATFSQISWFANTDFSAHAEFESVAFSGTAYFEDTSFAAGVRFDHVTFSALVGFDRAAFSTHATFAEATFCGSADFEDVTFSAGSDFDRATFLERARFDAVKFSAAAIFNRVTFHRDVSFQSSTFSNQAWFADAKFNNSACFAEVSFSAPAVFNGTEFNGVADFSDTIFSDNADFNDTVFSQTANFQHVTFSADTRFMDARFSGTARFANSTFTTAGELGPIVCQETLDLSGALFVAPVTIQAAATSVACVRTRWDSTATLRLRHAAVDLTDAVVTQPIAVAAHPAPFNGSRYALAEPDLTGDGSVRIMSVRGVDAAHLVLTNTDLTDCRFFGAFHLDQIRLDGETLFARTPPGFDIRRGVPLRWTDRQALAEEHHWRALPQHRAPLRSGWTSAPLLAPAAGTPGPRALAALYRQLRKAFEDGKDEPGAADFYYAEMEMRRLDRRRPRNRAERALLTGYWALSGYGLRALPALCWLGLAMTATVLALVMWGLPTNDLHPRTTGTLPAAGHTLTLATDTPHPAVTGSADSRFTRHRVSKATRVAVNSVVFRSSGQDLTATGEDIEMASRFFEPLLLAFAALAIRNRVKR